MNKKKKKRNKTGNPRALVQNVRAQQADLIRPGLAVSHYWPLVWLPHGALIRRQATRERILNPFYVTARENAPRKVTPR